MYSFFFVRGFTFIKNLFLFQLFSFSLKARKSSFLVIISNMSIQGITFLKYLISKVKSDMKFLLKTFEINIRNKHPPPKVEFSSNRALQSNSYCLDFLTKTNENLPKTHILLASKVEKGYLLDNNA